MTGNRRRRLLAVLTGGLLAAAGVVATAPAAHAAVGTVYVNCSAPSNGSGSQASPYNTLAAVDGVGFSAGDSILLARGTTCTGTVWPRGSGTAASPITLGAYGTGAAPVIDGGGAAYAVKLQDQGGWVVRDLEIKRASRYALYVGGSANAGDFTFFRLTNLVVHDVHGGTLDTKNTGLVTFENHKGARFHDVVVDGLTAYDTNLWSGLLVGYGGSDADSWQYDTQYRNTDVTVRNSTVHDTYGDGITVYGAIGALLEHNLVHDVGLQPAPVTIGTPNALWTWACKNCTVQFNEAYGTKSPGIDGGAFDIDYFSDNTVIQYNYGHDNQAYCVGVFGAVNYVNTGNVVRYNRCENNALAEVSLYTWEGGSIDGLQIYNNTFRPAAGTGVLWGQAPAYGSSPHYFRNNLVDGASTDVRGANTSGLSFDHNLYRSSTSTAGTYGETGSVAADPKLASDGHLQAGSPAFGAGVNVCAGTSGCDMGSRDYFGTPVTTAGTHNIGMDETAGTPAPSGSPANLIGDGGFESGSLNGWDQWPAGTASVVTGAAGVHEGTHALAVTTPDSGAYRTVSGLSPNTTYRLSGWLSAGGGPGIWLFATPTGGSQVSTPFATTTTPAYSTLTFTTGSTGSATVGVWRDTGSGGTGWLDDVSLLPEAATAIPDGSFESAGLTGWSQWPAGVATVGTAGAHAGTHAVAIANPDSGFYRTLTGLAPNTEYTLSGWLSGGGQGPGAWLFVSDYGGSQVSTPFVTSTTPSLVAVTFTTDARGQAQLGAWRDVGSGGTAYVDDLRLAITR